MTTIEELGAKTADERLKRLLTYLAADPANAALRADAAAQALTDGQPEIACEILAQAPDKLSNRELNLFGVAQIEMRNFAGASRTFEAIVSAGEGDAAVKFNLAWSLAMEKKFERALDLLDEQVTEDLAQAATLEVQLLHQLGNFDRAPEAARRHLARHGDDEALAAAVSVLALDIEDLDLARSCAVKARSHPDALATLGILELSDQKVDRALELFEQSLRTNANIPRAWIGRGLARMLAKQEGATSDLDRGAELFGDHIGSWIAAGWAHLIAGDLSNARQRFARALEIDENFAESHGSLAVVDVLEGQPAEAARRIAVARRLDRECFSAAFAQILITERQSGEASARVQLDKILETPVNARGDTVAAALARMGLKSA